MCLALCQWQSLWLNQRFFSIMMIVKCPKWASMVLQFFTHESIHISSTISIISERDPLLLPRLCEGLPWWPPAGAGTSTADTGHRLAGFWRATEGEGAVAAVASVRCVPGVKMSEEETLGKGQVLYMVHWCTVHYHGLCLYTLQVLFDINKTSCSPYIL